jgi:hypothetical protein
MVIHIVNGFEGEKAKFFTIYPQTGTVLRLGSDPKEPNTAAPGRASGPEYDRSRDRKRGRRADGGVLGDPRRVIG